MRVLRQLRCLAVVLPALAMAAPVAVRADEFDVARTRIDAAVARLAIPDWYWDWLGNAHDNAAAPASGGWPAPLAEIFATPRTLAALAPEAAANQERAFGFAAEVWRGFAKPDRPNAAGDPGQCQIRARDEIFLPYLAALDAIVVAWGAVPSAIGDVDAWHARLALGAGMMADPVLRDPELVARGARVRASAPAALSKLADLTRQVRGLDCPLGGPSIAVFPSPFGAIVIGTHGKDDYARTLIAEAALVVDPGGDDRYELGPVAPGRQRTILDLAGDDEYIGGDLALGGFAGLVDLAGNDGYRAGTGAQAAAVGGLAVAIDVDGDDVYEAASFSQAASLHGAALLAASPGDTSFRADDASQAFAAPGGASLLHEAGGRNAFQARGKPDPFARGGGLSLSQGFAMGARETIAGGVAVLRAEGIENRFDLGQFGQGAAYYGGVGILDAGPGRSSFVADRYAQGAGVHDAAGILVSRQGPADFALEVGVGQGLGLDRAIGLLLAGGGPNSYRSPALAQGASTAGGLGILADGHPGSAFLPAPSEPSGQGVRRTALTIGLGFRASAGEIEAPVPFATAILKASDEPQLSCPPGTNQDAAPSATPFGDLARAAPLFGASPEARAAYDAVVAWIRKTPEGVPGLVPDRDIGNAIALREIIRCAFAGPQDAAAKRLGDILLDRLAASDLANGDAYVGLARRLTGRDETGDARWRRVAAGSSCPARAVATMVLAADPPLPDRDAILRAAARDRCWAMRMVAWELAHRGLEGFAPSGDR